MTTETNQLTDPPIINRTVGVGSKVGEGNNTEMLEKVQSEICALQYTNTKNVQKWSGDKERRKSFRFPVFFVSRLPARPTVEYHLNQSEKPQDPGRDASPHFAYFIHTQRLSTKKQEK